MSIKKQRYTAVTFVLMWDPERRVGDVEVVETTAVKAVLHA